MRRTIALCASLAIVIVVLMLAACCSSSASRKKDPRVVTQPTSRDSTIAVSKPDQPEPSRPQPAIDDMLVEKEQAPADRTKPYTPHIAVSMPKEKLARAERKCLGLAAPSMALCEMDASSAGYAQAYAPEFNTEQYDHIAEVGFVRAMDKPLSTFSIDVDAASYSNVRRFLMSNSLPPKDAVRIEEMVNYFTYDYRRPSGQHPFSITTEVGPCPWNAKHSLVHIGLQGLKVETADLPKTNLVFLLDVSGSMDSPDKLPLLKTAMKLLVKNLRKDDSIAIAVYAGAAGLVLPPTPGTMKETILSAIENLEAGGSTAGGAGIQLAYKVAKEHFAEDGNNRVILATDGDFNVGMSSDGDLVRMIEEKRNDGIFLTVLGFGTGNYKDSKMEKLADKGNGNYAYIDNALEAKKVLVNEMGATLLTIAKDVKIQVEFNPVKVQAYRLVGYENRRLNDEDFNDDKKDAGELGAGHSVTALYEIVPIGSGDDVAGVDPLKYQTRTTNRAAAQTSDLLTVKFRYKKPDGQKSILITETLADRRNAKLSDNFTFSAAVAAFAMLLRDSEHKGDVTYEKVLDMARTARGVDANGYRAEFIRLVELAELLSAHRG